MSAAGCRRRQSVEVKIFKILERVLCPFTNGLRNHCHLPVLIHHLPVPIHHLPVPIHHLPVPIHQFPLTIHQFPFLHPIGKGHCKNSLSE